MSTYTNDVVTCTGCTWTSDVTQTSDVNLTNTSQFTAPEGCIVFPLSKFSPWYNPEDLVSFETHLQIQEIINVYLLGLLFTVCVPLNIVNIIVFWKHGIKERINLCLVCLSVADAIVVSTYFVLELDRLYSVLTNTEYGVAFAKHIINNMIHCFAGFFYVSGFMSTLIALERCLCVASPLRAQGLLPTKTMAVIIVTGCVVILGGYYVISLRWKVICMYDPFKNRMYDVYYSSQFYLQNKEILDRLEGLGYGIVLPGFYITGVSLFTGVTIAKLRQFKTWREHSSSVTASDVNANKDLTLIRMLIGTSILFVACSIPPPVIHSLHNFIPDLSLTGKYYNLYTTLITVQQFCYYVNSSFNFFIYYAFGTKFRTTVKGMFRSCVVSK